MAFVKTTWVDDAPPGVSAAQLNRMEAGIFDAVRGRTEDGLRIVRGIVTSSGSAIAGGTGFSVTHLGAGDCMVTYDTPFAAAAAAIAVPYFSGGPVVGRVYSQGPTQFSFYTFNSTTNVAIDSNFNFIAVGL